jgi:hypothetical protein
MTIIADIYLDIFFTYWYYYFVEKGREVAATTSLLGNIGGFPKL